MAFGVQTAQLKRSGGEVGGFYFWTWRLSGCCLAPQGAAGLRLTLRGCWQSSLSVRLVPPQGVHPGSNLWRVAEVFLPQRFPVDSWRRTHNFFRSGISAVTADISWRLIIFPPSPFCIMISYHVRVEGSWVLYIICFRACMEVSCDSVWCSFFSFGLIFSSIQLMHQHVDLTFILTCLCSVYADGSICLDILQNRWSPTYDVSSILTSIQVSRPRSETNEGGNVTHAPHEIILPEFSYICFFVCFLFLVVAGWAKPQQPRKQPGCTALSGKQAGVWEEGDGHRGAELGRQLSVFPSPLLPLIPLSSSSHHFSLSSLPHRGEKKFKKASDLWELKCHPYKKEKSSRTRTDSVLLANTF